MGVWFLMLVCSLSFPAIMLIAGRLFIKGAPKKINWTIGYRSPMSMKNADTWKFAHTVAGKFWRKWGVALPCTDGDRYAVRSGTAGGCSCDGGSLYHVCDDNSDLWGACPHRKSIAKHL